MNIFAFENVILEDCVAYNLFLSLIPAIFQATNLYEIAINFKSLLVSHIKLFQPNIGNQKMFEILDKNFCVSIFSV
jgi:hypothetical protein